MLKASREATQKWVAPGKDPGLGSLVLASRCEVSTDWLPGRDVVEAEVLEEAEVSVRSSVAGLPLEDLESAAPSPPRVAGGLLDNAQHLGCQAVRLLLDPPRLACRASEGPLHLRAGAGVIQPDGPVTSRKRSISAAGPSRGSERTCVRILP